MMLKLNLRKESGLLSVKAIRQQNGFTLIELVTVIAIVSILAVIAIPSYRQYVIRNAENDAKSKLLQIKLDLERWRSSAMSYKGFVPRNVDSNGDLVYEYDANDNKTIYLPIGSSSSDYLYKVTLEDGNGNSLIPVAGDGTTVDITTGRTWRMLAEPNSSGLVENSQRYLLTSTGVSCANTSTTLTIESTACGIGGESW